jgi:CRISPR-associated protein Csd1
MLLQALVEYAESRLPEKLADTTFEEREVPYLLEIRPDGSFADVTERLVPVPGLGRRVRRGQLLAVPRSPVHRNTGIHALLACDQIRYVLGVGTWTAKGRETNDLARHQAFMKLIKAAAITTEDPALRACSRFYDRPDQITIARAEFERRKILAGRLVALSVEGPVVNRLAVREYWQQQYWEVFSKWLAKGGESMCLASARIGPIALTHDRITGLIGLGGLSTGATLVSADKESFCSYGWHKGQNSPVSPDRASAYVLALNDLLRPGSPCRVDHGYTALIFWTRDPIATPNPIELIESAAPDHLARLPEMERARQQESNDFYLAALSCNGARIIIRAFVRESVEVVYDHVGRWFRDLSLIDVFSAERAAAPPLRKLLTAVATRYTPQEFVVAFVLRAIEGRRLGRAVLSASVASAAARVVPLPRKAS